MMGGEKVLESFRDLKDSMKKGYKIKKIRFVVDK